MPVRFHRMADTELIGARHWYDQARPGLGLAFATEVDRVVNLIEKHPARFPFHADAVRRAALRRFPFSIFFEDIDGVRYIWAVFHHRRDQTAIEQRRSS